MCVSNYILLIVESKRLESKLFNDISFAICHRVVCVESAILVF